MHKNVKGRTMKTKRTAMVFLMIALSTFAFSCGSSGEITEEAPNIDIGGIKVMLSMTSVNQSASKEMQFEGSPTDMKIRGYSIAISPDPTCTIGFVSLFDESDNTSDCAAGFPDTSRFLSTSSSVQMTENDSIPVGEYQCIKMIYCDTTIFTASTTHCNGTYYHDTFREPQPGGTAEPQVHAIYFGTAGDPAYHEVDSGEAAHPLPIANVISIISDKIATLTFIFDFTNKVYYEPGEGFCGVESPEVSAIAE